MPAGAYSAGLSRACLVEGAFGNYGTQRIAQGRDRPVNVLCAVGCRQDEEPGPDGGNTTLQQVKAEPWSGWCSGYYLAHIPCRR